MGNDTLKENGEKFEKIFHMINFNALYYEL